MEVMGGRGIGNLEIKWENNILKNFKESSHRLAKLEYNTLRRRSIQFCAHKIQTTKSRKAHTYTSQIPVIQYPPLHSLLKPLMPTVYFLNIQCSSLPPKPFWTSGFFFLNCFSWLSAWSICFHFSSLYSTFHHLREDFFHPAVQIQTFSPILYPE